MEALDIVKAPLRIAQFVGERLLGGGWNNLPALPQGEITLPCRLVQIPQSIILGEE